MAARGLVNAGAAGTGAAVAGAPGAVVGAGVGSVLGDIASKAILPAKLTRSELLSQAFEKPSTVQPLKPTVAPVLGPRQSSLQLPPPNSAGQLSLFGVTPTEPQPLEWPKARLLKIELAHDDAIDVLRDPLANAREKALARASLSFMPAAQVKVPSTASPAMIDAAKNAQEGLVQ